MFTIKNMLITSHLPKILELISENPTVMIIAPTGSGKSVGVPAFLATAGHFRTMITVPTRTAALSLAEYQRAIKRAQDPTINPNTYVGFAAEGNVQYNNETMIMYVTGGHTRRKLLTYFDHDTIRPIDFCDVLFVDEIHTGSIDTTIIISLWMKAAMAQVRVPRLVVASATPIPLTIYPVPVEYTVEAKAYPIEYNYIHQDLNTDDGSLYNETALKTVNIHTTTKLTDGHILVFAPGATEVETITNQIFQLLEYDKTVDIIPAFSALTQAEIELIYQQKEGIRKIIIATNIAEMSITIENIGFVVDTMLEKRSETSFSGGFRLTTHYISKDSAKQRSGRTGRTRSGVSYRMCTLEKYESFEEHRPMEIDRVPIFELVMELLDIGLDPQEIITGTSKQRIQDSTTLLKRLELIKMVDGKVHVTDLGHFAPQFQFSVKNATFLWKWIEAGHPVFPGIVVASLIDSYGPSYFWQPRKKPDMSIDVYNTMIKEHRQRYFSRFIGYNDLETCLNMWRDLTSSLRGIVGDQRQIAQWAKENSMNNKKIKELLLIVNQTIGKLKNSIDIKIGPFTTEGVMKAARPILKIVYSDQILLNKRGVNYVNPLTKEEYKLDNREALNMFIDKPPHGIIGLITAEIKTQKDVIFRLISFGIDFEQEGGLRESKTEKKTVSRAPIVTTGGKHLPKIPHWSQVPSLQPGEEPTYNFEQSKRYFEEEEETKKSKKASEKAAEKVVKLTEKKAEEIDETLELLASLNLGKK
jgi:HrpA-like RNA helicase